MQKGFKTILIFFWLNSPQLAKDRVATRVHEGGHNIPEDVIERRYYNGIRNLFKIYLPIVDRAIIFDNSKGKQEILAEKNGELIFMNEIKFQQLKAYENG